MTEIQRLKKLTPVTGKVHMVLDTDTKNEMDDQFALTYARRLHECGDIFLDAVYAAPFTHSPAPEAGEGMEQSYEEIIRILGLMGVTETDGYVFRGADRFMDTDAVDSPAARDLVRRAMTFSEEEPLYVVAIGAITNIASAILMEPAIIDRIVVVWLGGTDVNQRFASEYNLMQDRAASRIILDCGVPFVQLPCRGVVDRFATTVSELERFIDGKTVIGSYLTSLVRDADHGRAYSKVIWDVTAVGWIVHPEWFETELIHTPYLTEIPDACEAFRVLDCYKEQRGTLYWSHDNTRHLMRAIKDFNRDGLFYDLFSKINNAN